MKYNNSVGSLINVLYCTSASPSIPSYPLIHPQLVPLFHPTVIVIGNWKSLIIPQSKILG